MVSGTLYTYADSYRGIKCRVAAAYGGASLKVVEVKSDDSSHHHVPAFESDDKKVHLIETNAIAYYLANDQLRGGNGLEERSRVLQWLNWGSQDVYSAVASWVYPALGLVESTPAHVNAAKNELKNIFEFLNNYFKTRTYLVGERLTLADVSLAADLLLAYEHVADEEWRKPYVNTNRWFTTVVNQAHFKKVNGEVKLAAKAVEYDPKRKVEKPAAKKEEKPAAKMEEKKPEPKPAAKKEEKKDDEDEGEDEIYAQEPKQNDPFATMPKGNFNMDEFKRVYSNEDTATKAIPYFWQHFEKDFYSIWYCEYKYSSELTQVFMSSNLIGGMFQRIEKLRKNAFASMGVFGENNNNLIVGV